MKRIIFLFLALSTPSFADDTALKPTCGKTIEECTVVLRKWQALAQAYQVKMRQSQDAEASDQVEISELKLALSQKEPSK